MAIVNGECPDKRIKWPGSCAFNYIGTVNMWIKPFREQALTLPWGEDVSLQGEYLGRLEVYLSFV